MLLVFLYGAECFAALLAILLCCRLHPGTDGKYVAL
jgi:hypothetical protein